MAEELESMTLEEISKHLHDSVGSRPVTGSELSQIVGEICIRLHELEEMVQDPAEIEIGAEGEEPIVIRTSRALVDRVKETAQRMGISPGEVLARAIEEGVEET